MGAIDSLIAQMEAEEQAKRERAIFVETLNARINEARRALARDLFPNDHHRIDVMIDAGLL